MATDWTRVGDEVTARVSDDLFILSVKWFNYSIRSFSVECFDYNITLWRQIYLYMDSRQMQNLVVFKRQNGHVVNGWLRRPHLNAEVIRMFECFEGLFTKKSIVTSTQPTESSRIHLVENDLLKTIVITRVHIHPLVSNSNIQDYYFHFDDSINKSVVLLFPKLLHERNLDSMFHLN